MADIREKLIMFLYNADENAYWDTSDLDFLGKIADYLIANGVIIAEEKPEKPSTDLRGKCGGCDYAVPVPAFGSTYAYVKCTHPEHLAKYRKARHHSGIRQRTTRACKKYRQKEGL